MKLPNKKFYISANTTFWVGFSLIVSLIAYAVLSFARSCMTNWDTMVQFEYLVEVLRDVVLVIASILGTTFLTSFMIEIRSKNDLYENIIANDFWGTPIFYRNLNPETKQQILATLERDLIFGENQQLEFMYRNIKEKLQQLSSESYYYEDCSYKVTCKIQKDRIEKCITRTIKIRAYRPNTIISNFPIVTWSGQPLDGLTGVTPFTFRHAILDGKEVPRADIEERESSACSLAGVDSGYSFKITQLFKPSIPISPDKDTIISVSYDTVTPIDDIIYTCRAQVPCKKFSVDFHIISSQEYKVYGRAFGFFDAAAHSPIVESANQTVLAFNDWIFPYDGVVITFTRKNT